MIVCMLRFNNSSSENICLALVFWFALFFLHLYNGFSVVFKKTSVSTVVFRTSCLIKYLKFQYKLILYT